MDTTKSSQNIGDLILLRQRLALLNDLLLCSRAFVDVTQHVKSEAKDEAKDGTRDCDTRCSVIVGCVTAVIDVNEWRFLYLNPAMALKPTAADFDPKHNP